MNKLHAKTKDDFRRLAGKETKHAATDRYLQSGHSYYGISVPAKRMLAKQWLKDNAGISSKDAIAYFDSMTRGESYDEKSFPSIILEYSASLRKALTFPMMDRWLDHLVGWAEIDGFCSNTFAATEMTEDFDRWSLFIRKLSSSKNINKRRAALVFLTRPLHSSNDLRVLGLSLEIIGRLKDEKEIIITKAVSWLLRSGVRYHKKAIAEYITATIDSLPKIAIRETTRKIRTGRK